MPLATSVVLAHLQDDVEEDITIYLNTGNPGTSGTANRVNTSILPPATINGTNNATPHWSISVLTATVNVNVNFGNTTQAINNVSHFSMFKGASFFASGSLTSTVNIVNGAAVSITANNIRLIYSTS